MRHVGIIPECLPPHLALAINRAVTRNPQIMRAGGSDGIHIPFSVDRVTGKIVIDENDRIGIEMEIDPAGEGERIRQILTRRNQDSATAGD